MITHHKLCKLALLLCLMISIFSTAVLYPLAQITDIESTETESTLVKSETIESKNGEPESGEAENRESESREPESGEPKGGDHESTVPENEEPKSGDHENTEPESTEPESTELESREAENSEAENREPESGEAEMPMIPREELKHLAISSLERLDSTTVVVWTYEELKLALSTDNGFEKIYLGTNIEGPANGIMIHNSKKSIMINGCLPKARNMRHHLTLLSAETESAAFYLDPQNNTTKNITFKNIEIVNSTNEELLFIPENLSGVTAFYQTGIYRGVQLFTNPQGTVRFSDFTYTIVPTINFDTVERILANRVFMDGTISMKVTSSDISLSSLLSLTNENPELHILDYADVTIDIYGFVIDIGVDNPDVTIHPHAYVSITANSGFTHISQNIENLLVSSDSTLAVTQGEALTPGTVKINNSLEVQPRGSLIIMRMSGLSGSPLIFTGENSQAIFNDPKRVILFAPGDDAIRFSQTGTLKITTKSINVWQGDTFGIGTLTYIWNNIVEKLFTLTATYNQGETVSFEHTLDASAPFYEELNKINFNPLEMSFFTLGNVNLRVSPVTSASTSIRGLTDATIEHNDTVKASLSIEYTDLQGYSRIMEQNIYANKNGFFDVPLLYGPPKAGSQIIVISSLSSVSLRRIIDVHDASDGVVSFTKAPERIAFSNAPMNSTTPILCDSGSLTLTVSDTRQTFSSWKIAASISHPLAGYIPNTTTLHYLENALVFVNDRGESTPLNNHSLIVHEQLEALTEKVDIIWENSTGILLEVPTGGTYSNVSYTTTIYWELMLTP